MKNPTTKPHLKPEHIKNRLDFSTRWLQKLAEGTTLYYCFLDEKWFYTTSRRKKEKHLPAAEFESLDETFQTSRKVKNRRHPCKVMYLGVVGPPIENKTDGRIFLQRVSETKIAKKSSFNMNFSPYYKENNRLKMGEWRKLLSDGTITVENFLSNICRLYKIEPMVGKDLCLVYKNFKISPRAKNIEYDTIRLRRDDTSQLLEGRTIDIPRDDNASIFTRPIRIEDLKLKIEIPKGRTLVKDMSCNSTFMINTVDAMGQSIRDAYSFVSHDHPIYLFIDNAGGHGTKEIKEKYVNRLRDKYNVLVEWQIPHSPETNMLDLGVWRSLQSTVEKMHRLKVMQKDVLAGTVEKAFWSPAIGVTILHKVHERWKLVLELIIAGKGSNNLVEKHRGLKAKLEDLPTVPDSDDEDVVVEQLKKVQEEEFRSINELYDELIKV